ncbi:type VI secretion protein, VC_A0111 family [Lysobacter enzymogenes]|uniref:Type VI secretion protein, VC_A0111 family n=1 Tax=Lysobacter enzymogenes TaxID=69 RepID=A0A0S2DBA3_LYSEN|nr:type VI secretion system baseplate subunit TssG [Lysobacter enzymogenes]ALN55811.1 type VI secretion protein, VC_A0111 family [Lysobacter enzymogenes]QCW24796.1 type VI secretion system baseplate subunit TssG [Lysobacter enzymogenes]
MPTAKRRIDPGVAQQVLAEPHRFQFFQAMRIFEHLFARQGVPLRDVLPFRLRFANSLSLGFPASEIEQAVACDQQGVELETAEAIEAAVAAQDIAEVRVVPGFIGLLGGAGVMPLHYTETIAQREIYLRDRTARAFLDMFANRAVAQHYAAWKKYRLHLQYELDRRERFLPLLLSLAGVGLHALRDRMVDGEGDVFDQAVAHYAGGIRQHPMSATFMQRILSDYFQAPLRVEQFVGAWYAVPEQQRSRLGMANARLGSTALAGDRVWQRDLRLRLWIGPLDRENFQRFLPGGSAARALAKWLNLLAGSTLEYEVRLVLRAQDVQGVRMDEQGGARLGWDSYLCSRPSEIDRADTRYHLQTLQ